MGLVSFLFYNYIVSFTGTSFVGQGVSIILSVTIGAIVYGLLIFIFKVEELDFILNIIKNKIKTH